MRSKRPLIKVYYQDHQFDPDWLKDAPIIIDNYFTNNPNHYRRKRQRNSTDTADNAAIIANYRTLCWEFVQHCWAEPGKRNTYQEAADNTKWARDRTNDPEIAANMVIRARDSYSPRGGELQHMGLLADSGYRRRPPQYDRPGKLHQSNIIWTLVPRPFWTPDTFELLNPPLPSLGGGWVRIDTRLDRELAAITEQYKQKKPLLLTDHTLQFIDYPKNGKVWSAALEIPDELQHDFVAEQASIIIRGLSEISARTKREAVAQAKDIVLNFFLHEFWKIK